MKPWKREKWAIRVFHCMSTALRWKLCNSLHLKNSSLDIFLLFIFFLFFFSTSSSYFAALKSRWRESALLWNEKLKTHETEKSKKKMKKKEKRVVRFIAHSLRAFYVILEHFVESRCWFFYLSFMFIQKFLHEIYDGKSCLKSFSSGLFSSSRSYRTLEFICVHVS